MGVWRSRRGRWIPLHQDVDHHSTSGAAGIGRVQQRQWSATAVLRRMPTYVTVTMQVSLVVMNIRQATFDFDETMLSQRLAAYVRHLRYWSGDVTQWHHMKADTCIFKDLLILLVLPSISVTLLMIMLVFDCTTEYWLNLLINWLKLNLLIGFWLLIGRRNLIVKLWASSCV